LERILADPLFANSRRSAKLLRYVVEYTLDGRVDHLKERTLGIEVFQREPDYDTNRDPVVRTTAVDIRKRLAQYYQDSPHDSEIRILLPAGNYLPEFRLPPEWPPDAAGYADLAPRESLPEKAVAAKSPSLIRIPLLLAVLLAALAGAAVASFVLLKPFAAPSALDRFWRPVLNSPDAVLLLIGGVSATDPKASRLDAPPISIIDLQRAEQVAFADATALSRIAGTLFAKGKPFHIRQQQLAKFEDLRDGPVVLLGAFNNDWTLRLSKQARFYFDRDPVTHDGWIVDRENPNDRKWLVHQAAPFTEVPEDFALVSRVLDPTTGHPVVTAAGISKYGTAAAGEFLTDPSFLKEATRSAPKDWDRKNLQLVIETKLVGESSAPPTVVAAHYW